MEALRIKMIDSRSIIFALFTVVVKINNSCVMRQKHGVKQVQVVR